MDKQMDMPAEKDEADSYMICPYDKIHKILKHRMHRHLEKCAKQHPDINLTLCPFNALHRMDPKDAEKHEANCPDRHTFLDLMDGAPVSPPVGVLPVPVEPQEIDSSQHYWDDEVTIGNTLQAVKENAKIKNVYLANNLSLSRSEKKKHQTEERLRYCQAKDASEKDLKASIKKQGSHEESLKKLELLSLNQGNETVEKKNTTPASPRNCLPPRGFPTRK